MSVKKNSSRGQDSCYSAKQLLCKYTYSHYLNWYLSGGVLSSLYGQAQHTRPKGWFTGFDAPSLSFAPGYTFVQNFLAPRFHFLHRIIAQYLPHLQEMTTPTVTSNMATHTIDNKYHVTGMGNSVLLPISKVQCDVTSCETMRVAWHWQVTVSFHLSLLFYVLHFRPGKLLAVLFLLQSWILERFWMHDGWECLGKEVSGKNTAYFYLLNTFAPSSLVCLL